MDFSNLFSAPASAEKVAPNETPYVFTAASAARADKLQRTIDLLQREALWPFFEPVECARVTNNRAVSVQDVVNELYQSAYGSQS